MLRNVIDFIPPLAHTPARISPNGILQSFVASGTVMKVRNRFGQLLPRQVSQRSYEFAETVCRLVDFRIRRVALDRVSIVHIFVQSPILAVASNIIWLQLVVWMYVQYATLSIAFTAQH